MVRTFTKNNFNDVGKLDAVKSMNVFKNHSPSAAINLVHPGAHNATIQ